MFKTVAFGTHPLVIVALTAVAVSLFAGCADFESVSCSDDSECREALGIGYGCGASGLCLTPEESFPKSCSRFYPSDFIRNIESYNDGFVIGVISEQDNSDAFVGAQVAIEEFATAASNSDGGIPVAAVQCVVGDEAGQQATDHERFLTQTLNARSVVLTTKTASTLPLPTRTNRILTVPNDEQVYGGENVRDNPEAAIVPVAPTENQELEFIGNRIFQDVLAADAVDEGRLMGFIYAGSFAGALVDTVVGGFNAALSDEGLTPNEQEDTRVEAFACCGVGTACSSDDLLSGVEGIVSQAEQQSTGGDGLYLVARISCRAAVTAWVEALNTIRSNSTGLTAERFRDTVRGIYMDSRGYTVGTWTLLDYPNGSSDTDSLADLITGVAPVANRDAEAYESFNETFLRLAPNPSALVQQLAVPFVYDATWLALLGSYHYFVGEASFDDMTSSDVAERLLLFNAEEPSNESITSFPVTTSRLSILESAIRSSGTTFDIDGASGPLDISFQEEASRYRLNGTYFADWRILKRSSDACLNGLDDEGTPGDSFACPVLSENVTRYP